MNIIETTEELRRTLAPVRGRERIAFVPTMGCLHEGHLGLIRKARRLADIVVVSIYINPMQFGPNEDFDAYPRTFEQDSALCEKEGVDIIFHPHNLYPVDGIKVSLRVSELDGCLCGASRPGHFNGVVTVVNMLFNIVQPDIAIFGEKDWQQLAIISRMVSDLHMGVEIIGAPTLRENDGVALSSRNRYLSIEDRSKAPRLHEALQSIQNLLEQGETQSSKLIELGKARLADAGITPEYLEIRNAVTLQTANTIDAPCRVFIAARIGNTRLIDNIPLEHATDRESDRIIEPATETLL
ncbi:MAG: pantoate--beta-alanine ligase [Mariprofundaceae bacterium]|nr:pantoate--beta-alanine ligase [Mariprofundaceae bacterium]